MVGERPRTATQRYAQILRDNLKGIKLITNEKDRWHVLSKELSQKQELIHRMLKEYDEKTENLKMIGDEIVELRKQLRLLLSENTLLKKRLNHEEKLELHNLVTQEIVTMNSEELRHKLVKVCQAYQDERIRNEEFEKALKAAHRDLTQVREYQREFDLLQKEHMEKSKKLLAMQQELQKCQLYRDTIKKQEKVITK